MEHTDQNILCREVVGNLHDEPWAERAAEADIEWLDLDRWTAQKSRFVARSDRNREYRVALERHTRLRDGDILLWEAGKHHLVAIRLRLGEVLEIRPATGRSESPDLRCEHYFELGHAIGNQHWPAVARQGRIYVPLTVDRRVMESVMRSHHFEAFDFSFRAAEEVIPYFSPHEVRRLFGASEPEAEHHHHPCHGA